MLVNGSFWYYYVVDIPYAVITTASIRHLTALNLFAFLFNFVYIFVFSSTTNMRAIWREKLQYQYLLNLATNQKEFITHWMNQLKLPL